MSHSLPFQSGELIHGKHGNCQATHDAGGNRLCQLRGNCHTGILQGAYHGTGGDLAKRA